VVELEEGESVLLSVPAWERQSNLTGTLTLTNARVVFEPRQPVRLEVNLHRIGVETQRGFAAPLPNVVSARLVPAWIGKGDCLEILARHQKGLFQVDNVREWVQAIHAAQRGEPAPAAVQAPLDPSQEAPSFADPLAVPPCPRCGASPVREPNGMLRCPTCSPSG
jgi:hypothetical protein